MFSQFKNVLITGGCGFIGSNFVNYIVKRYPGVNFVNVDSLNYCGNIDNVTVSKCPNYTFYHLDIANETIVLNLLYKHNIDCIIHFAAQSHVDTSFNSAHSFTYDNVVANGSLLEATRKYSQIKLFVYISTDEIYGESIHDHQIKTEDSLPCPTNPYSASKIAAEMYVNAYRYSFKLPSIIIRSNNVYGPRQYHEKLIPRFIELLRDNERCTIHGDGHYMRSFLHTYDFCRALECVLLKGVVGEVYNFGSEDEYSVLDIAGILWKAICPERSFDDCVEYVQDRAFNDTRYLVDCTKLKKLGWSQLINFESGIRSTIDWYLHGQELKYTDLDFSLGEMNLSE